MIIAISIMRRRADIGAEQFRTHWRHPHGTMTAGLPGVRSYVLGRLEDAPPTNDLARELAIDGFPVLSFDTLEEREKAYTSPRILECNKDSEHFVGAVRRLVTLSDSSAPPSGAEKLVKLYLLKVGKGGQDEAWSAAVGRAVSALPGFVSYGQHQIQSQAGPPQSRIPALELDVAGFAEVWLEGEPDPAQLRKVLSDEGISYDSTAIWRGNDIRLV